MFKSLGVLTVPTNKIFQYLSNDEFQPFQDHVSPQFFSGGAGYLLSREALKAYVERGILSKDRPRQCNMADGPEDTRLGKFITLEHRPPHASGHQKQTPGEKLFSSFSFPNS